MKETEQEASETEREVRKMKETEEEANRREDTECS